MNIHNSHLFGNKYIITYNIQYNISKRNACEKYYVIIVVVIVGDVALQSKKYEQCNALVLSESGFVRVAD